MERRGRSSRLWQLAALNALASLFLLASFARNGIGTPTVGGCTAQIIDFHVFWSAARLALEGTPLSAFNQDALNSVVNACDAGWLPWLHPPAGLLLVTPFGMLALVPAWLAFTAASLLLLFLALRPFVPHGAGVLALIFAPALLPALLAGQFTTLWLAGLLAALWALRNDRWMIAGFCIAGLTLKPTLGLMIPFALLGVGAWRVIVVATLSTIAIHGLATLVYGFDYWSLLIEVYGLHSLNGIRELGARDTMTSLAAALAGVGVPGDWAVRVNLMVAVGLALLVCLTWRRLGPSDVSAALLTSSIPLATPYLWHYDSAFLALTALFLARHHGFAPPRLLS
ncbi:MAG: glycosyltransferase family 87 protein, partial [Pseudomonadota bacterium]